MAKKVSDTTFGSDKAKVRVFFAELEGSNESVQEAMKTMVAAMTRPVRIIAEQKVGAKSATLLEDSSGEDEAAFSDEESAAEMLEKPVIQSTRAPRGSGKKTDRNAGLQQVADLNFRPMNEKALKEFFTEKNPKNDQELVLLTLYFMQHKMKLSKIGPNHVMSAFKEVGKPIPADLRQTIRNTMNSRMWLKFSDIEDIQTTTQGDNAVEHDLGNKSE